jgi:hypothetical protein
VEARLVDDGPLPLGEDADVVLAEADPGRRRVEFRLA